MKHTVYLKVDLDVKDDTKLATPEERRAFVFALIESGALNLGDARPGKVSIEVEEIERANA